MQRPEGLGRAGGERRLQLTTQLTAIGSTGSSHGEAKRDDMARGEARGLAAALLEEIRAGAEDPLTTPLTQGALPGELQLSLKKYWLPYLAESNWPDVSHHMLRCIYSYMARSAAEREARR